MDIISILNILTFLVPLIWLALILAYRLKNHEVNLRLIKYGIFSVVALAVLQGAYSTIATYNAWKLDRISRYLLPPYNATYFYGYAYFHFWRGAVASFLVGAACAVLLFALYKYSSGRILDKSEIALGFFTAFVVGWPKIFAYFTLVFVLLILKGVINVFVLKNKSNLQIASSIALSALAVAGFSNFIMRLPFFDNFKL